MMIVTESISLAEVKKAAANLFGNMVKGVVDVERQMLAIDAELHADLEALLLENGSKQKDLWGINLYPEVKGESFIEFDSMINMRPSQGNNSRGVDSEEIRKQIIRVVSDRVKP